MRIVADADTHLYHRELIVPGWFQNMSRIQPTKRLPMPGRWSPC